MGNSILWSTGARDSVIASVVSAPISGIYFTVSKPLGCKATSNRVDISVLPVPTQRVVPLGPASFCQGGQVRLAARPLSTGNSLIWTSDNALRDSVLTATTMEILPYG